MIFGSAMTQYLLTNPSVSRNLVFSDDFWVSHHIVFSDYFWVSNDSVFIDQQRLSFR
jgi:hypothetical protein